MIWIIAIAVTVALFYWIVPASRGVERKATEIEPALRQLLDTDLENAFLSVQPQFSRNKRIQYTRYQTDAGSIGIELVFTNARWSEDFFPKVVTAASGADLPYDIQDAADSDVRFVFVRFGQSTKIAARFGREILVSIFGFDENYRFRVRIN